MSAFSYIPLHFIQTLNSIDQRVEVHIWMSHVAHINESWHTWKRVMAHIGMSHDTLIVDQRVEVHIWMSHVAHMRVCAMHMRAYECLVCAWVRSLVFRYILCRCWIPQINKSRCTYSWVMSHICVCVRCVWVHSPMWPDTLHSIRYRCWIMSLIWMSRVTHMNEPCHRYEWVMSHIWMRHVTLHSIRYRCWIPQVNKSSRTYEWVMSHIWMRHVAHMNESCRTYEWVMSPMWLCAWHVCECISLYSFTFHIDVESHRLTSRVAHVDESCRTYACV